jgi:hypothetical protein
MRHTEAVDLLKLFSVIACASPLRCERCLDERMLYFERTRLSRPFRVCARAENGELLAESEAGLMRFVAFFARHPWLRNGLVFIA